MTHPTVSLDDTVHQRSRLGILAILSAGDRVDFGYFRQVLDLSPGNLSRHLTMLVQAHLIAIEKGYQGRRPRTWVTITTTGRRAYQSEMTALRSLLALADATTAARTAEVQADASDEANERLASSRTSDLGSEAATGT